MSDAWEILVGHSTAGDAWERLGSLTTASCETVTHICETVTHAYESGTFNMVDAGVTFNIGASVVTFNTVEIATIDFEAASGSIEFDGTGILEVKSC